MSTFIKTLKSYRKFFQRVMSGFLLLMIAVSAQASQVGQYPWEQIMNKIFQSLSGPVAYAFAGVAIVICGLTVAFADLQGGARKAVNVALGISLAFGAATILSTFFQFSGALVN